MCSRLDLPIVVAAILDMVWQWRNKIIFEKGAFSLDAIIDQIRICLEVWKECAKKTDPPKQPVHSRIPNGINTVVISFDSAISEEGSTQAVVIRDGRNHFMKAIVNFGIHTNVYLVEDLASLEAITKATSSGWTSFLVLGDSKEVIDSLNEVLIPQWQIEHIICKIWDLCDNLAP
ncbi:hypothetical protein Ancab_032180, partial [Ancistrocladus abbreviatus]